MKKLLSIIAIASIAFLASCQKDDMLEQSVNPTTATTTVSSAKEANETVVSILLINNDSSLYDIGNVDSVIFSISGRPIEGRLLTSPSYWGTHPKRYYKVFPGGGVFEGTYTGGTIDDRVSVAVYAGGSVLYVGELPTPNPNEINCYEVWWNRP